MKKVMLCLMLLLVAVPLASADVPRQQMSQAARVRLSDGNAWHGNYMDASDGFAIYYLFDFSSQLQDNETITVTSASLYLQTYRIGTGFLDGLYGVTDTSWAFSNPMTPPAIGSLLMTIQPPNSWGGPVFASDNLTSHVSTYLNSGNRKVSLAIKKYDNLENTGIFDDYFEYTFLIVNYTATQAPTPVISPNGGVYSTQQTVAVSITDTDPTAVIRYTTDGSDPTPSSQVYSAPFNVSSTTIVKAKAWVAGARRSKMATTQYRMPAVGTATGNVVASDDTFVSNGYPDAVIGGNAAVIMVGNYYSASLTKDLIKFNVPALAKPAHGRTIINAAILYWCGGDEPYPYPNPNYDVPTATLYQVDNDSWTESTVTWNSAPAFGPAIGTFDYPGIYTQSFQDVKSFIQARVDNASTSFSFGIDAPNWYVDNSHRNMFRMYSKENSYSTSYGPNLWVDYSFEGDPYPYDNLTISPNGGAIVGPKTVTISGGGTGAAIHYTLNGVDPTESDSLYTAPFVVDNTTTVKAKAFLNEYVSPVATASFYLTTLATVADVKENFESYNLGILGQGWVFPTEGSLDTAEVIMGVNGTKVAQTYTGNPGKLYMQGYDGGKTFETGIDIDNVYPAKAYYSVQMRPRSYGKNYVCQTQFGTQRYDGYLGIIMSVDPTDPLVDYMGRFSFQDAGYWTPYKYSENIRMFYDNETGYIFDIALDLTFFSYSNVRVTLYYRNVSLGGNWIKSTAIDNVAFDNACGIQLYQRGYLRGYMNGGECDNLRMGAGTFIGDSPTISPNGGNFTTPQTVTISAAPAGTTIHYTVNGNNPKMSDPVYTGSFTLADSATVKAQAFLSDGFAVSQIAQADFTCTLPRLAAPVISPAGGDWPASPQTVTITAAAGASIYYTLNGSTPDNTSTLYTGPFGVSFEYGSPAFVKAIAYPATGAQFLKSEVASVTFGEVITSDYFRNPTSIPNGSAAVDGDLSDWAGATWASMTYAYDGNPTDIAEAYYTARWTPNKIYVAVKVRDTALYFTDNYTEWNARDAIEIYLHTNGFNADYVYPNSEAAQEYAVGIKNSDHQAVWTDLGYKLDVPSVCEFEAAGRVVNVSGQNWLYSEVAMKPFQYMGAFVSQPSVASPVTLGQVIGLDVVVAGNDNVTIPGGYTGMKSENNFTGKSNLYANFGPHLLVARTYSSADLAAVLAAMDSTPGGPGWNPNADIDGDGEVTSTDLSIVLANLP